MDNTIIPTDPNVFDVELAPSKNRNENGKYVPYGLAGYVVNECHVVCSECYGNEESDYEDPDPIFGDSEFDFPGSCYDCGKLLDVYQLVYLSQDEDLWYKVHMAEQMGEYDELPSNEEIAKYVEREAYEIGMRESPDYLDEIDSLEEIDIAYYTESAHYINNVAPKLRALAGYLDSGKGTYTEVPSDTAYYIFNEGALEKFREGWYDGAKETLEN